MFCALLLCSFIDGRWVIRTEGQFVAKINCILDNLIKRLRKTILKLRARASDLVMNSIQRHVVPKPVRSNYNQVFTNLRSLILILVAVLNFMSHKAKLVGPVEGNHLDHWHFHILFSKKSIHWIANVISFYVTCLRMKWHDCQCWRSDYFDEFIGFFCCVYWMLDCHFLLVLVNLFYELDHFACV